MGIDKESDVAANLQIGPTSLGMVRLYVEADGVEIPMDFDPAEAREIAEELTAAADRAEAVAAQGRQTAGRGASGRAEGGRGRPPGRR